MSVARRALGTVGTAVLLAVAGALSLVALAPATGHHLLVVAGGSMEPTLATGGMVLVQRVEAGDVAAGDVITYVGHGGGLTTHRVVSVHDVAGEPHYRTQGDANPTPDVDLAPSSGLVGRVRADLSPAAPLVRLITGSRTQVAAPGLLALWLGGTELRTLLLWRRRRNAPAAERSAPFVPSAADAASGSSVATVPTQPVPSFPPPGSSRVPGRARRPTKPRPAAPVRAGTPRPAAPRVAAAPPGGAPVLAPGAALSFSAPRRRSPRRPRLRGGFPGGVALARALVVVLAVSTTVGGLTPTAAVLGDEETVTINGITTRTLAAPTGVLAVFDCLISVDDWIDLSWTASATATDYEVWVSIGGAADVLVTTVSAPTTSYRHSGVSLAETHDYRVRAIEGGWTADASRVVEITPAVCV